MQNEQKKETKVKKKNNRSMFMRLGAAFLVLLMIAPTVLSVLMNVM